MHSCRRDAPLVCDREGNCLWNVAGDVRPSETARVVRAVVGARTAIWAGGLNVKRGRRWRDEVDGQAAVAGYQRAANAACRGGEKT